MAGGGAPLQQTDQGLRIFTAEPLDITTLEKTEPQLFREETYLGWDSKEERVRAEKQFRLGAIVLKRQPLTDPVLNRKPNVYWKVSGCMACPVYRGIPTVSNGYNAGAVRQNGCRSWRCLRQMMSLCWQD